jgi:hypothetical protein
MSNTIEEQLASMRSSLRRQRLFNLALVGIAVAAATVAATRPAGDATFDMVTCKNWKLVDKDGKLRIGAGIEPGGIAAMAWLDTNGKPRVGVSVSNDSAGMTWFDKDGKVRIMADTQTDGQAGMTWFDKDGKVRIGAAINAADKVILPTRDLTPKP